MIVDQVTFSSRHSTDVVQLSGEIDLANAASIGRRIVQHVLTAKAVLIDLTLVSFLDSAGVRLLDGLVGDLDDAGTPVRFVVGERGPVKMLLRLCAFRDDLLATDLEQAAHEMTG